MKRISRHAWLCTIGVLGLVMAHAQNQNTAPDFDRSRQQDRFLTDTLQTQSRTATPLQRAIWLSELNGMRIQNRQGTEIGTVDDVLVDLVRGRIPYLIVDAGGGFLGIGGRSVAVPAQYFDRSPYRNYLVANLDQDSLGQFPQTDGGDKNSQAWSQLMRNYRSQVGMDRARQDMRNRGADSVILRRGDEISGEDVFSPTNVELGEVSDLLVQLDQNRVLLARIDVEGYDRRTIAAPPLLFYTTRDGENLRIDSERNELLAAPSLDLSRGTAINPNWLSNLYRHFQINAQNFLAGILSETRATGRELGDRLDTRARAGTQADRRIMTRDLERDQEFAREFRAETREFRDDIREIRDDTSDLLNNQRQAVRPSEQFPDWNREFATQYRDAGRESTWDPQWQGQFDTSAEPFPPSGQIRTRQSRDLEQDRWSHDQDEFSDPRSSAPRSYSPQRAPLRDQQVNRLLRREEVVGKDVRNFQGRTLGEIQDVVINMDQGQITHVIVSRGGGLLSFGGNRVALPVELLRNSENWDYFLVDMTPDLLSEAPEFEKDKFRRMSNVGWMQDINQFFTQRITGLRNQIRSLSREQAQTINLTLLSDLIGQAAQWAGGASAGQVRDVLMNLPQGRVASVMISPRLSPEYWTAYPVNAIQRRGNQFILDSRLADRRYQVNPDNWLDQEGRVMTRQSDTWQDNQ